MTDEDEEFNRIEREAAMRKAAVHATVTKKPWQGLTFAEICECENEYLHLFARAIEAKLKEKNDL